MKGKLVWIEYRGGTNCWIQCPHSLLWKTLKGEATHSNTVSNLYYNMYTIITKCITSYRPSKSGEFKFLPP